MAKLLHSDPKSGSVGAVTFFSGRNGPVARQRVNPSNPQTLAQQNIRSILATCAGEWRGLTDAQRHAWSALSAQMPGNLTGFQAYVKLNVTRVEATQAVVTDPPVIPAFGVMTCTGLTSVAGVIKLVAVADTVLPDKFIIEAASQRGVGIQNVNSDYRRIATVVGHTVSADIDISAAYLAKFGAQTVGQRVFARITALKDGFKGVPLSFSAINA